MAGQNRKWESRLWSYVSSGDGMHCPVISKCDARKNGGWCADDHSDELKQLLDSDDQFDPSSYDFMEPQEGIIFPVVEKLAEKLLEKGKISSLPVPIELISLADEKRPVEVRVLRLKACHAAIWRLHDVWLIQLADHCSSARNRLTLFHEAFHILAHCRCDSTPAFDKRGAEQGSFNELLADYFSMCVLMPREWVKVKWAEVANIGKMAEIFEVPKSTMWFRLRELKLV
jgi:hypothetical protein